MRAAALSNRGHQSGADYLGDAPSTSEIWPTASTAGPATKVNPTRSSSKAAMPVAQVRYSGTSRDGRLSVVRTLMAANPDA